MDTLPKINYHQLMDLRVDYAFKIFATQNPHLLMSLLNAIFANKSTGRVITDLTIRNPYLEKSHPDDKLSILDIRAQLEDGTAVLIEMHLYGLGELKAKTIRSWARAYSEELTPGDHYTDQPPTIAITFADGPINALSPDGEEKIHRLCMIMDRDDHTIFTDAMELHYIDMKAFAKAMNQHGHTAQEAMFTHWLSLITQKEIADKTYIDVAYQSKEEIKMAVNALEMLSDDKIARQAYQRRQDEVYFYNKGMFELNQYKQLAKQQEQRARQQEQRAKQQEQLAKQQGQRAEQAETEITALRQQLAQLQAQLAK